MSPDPNCSVCRGSGTIISGEKIINGEYWCHFTDCDCRWRTTTPLSEKQGGEREILDRWVFPDPTHPAFTFWLLVGMEEATMNQFPTPDPRILAELYGPPSSAIEVTLHYLLARRDHLNTLIMLIETEHKLHGPAQAAANLRREPEEASS